jgi:exodeoxyribonuclease VII small subunit
MPIKKPENMSFEDTLEELEQIVGALEQGEVPLEESLKRFERGISLARAGQVKLKHAEQQVSILLREGGEEKLQPFHSEENE